MRILGITASSVFKTFIDNFNRTTSGNLGTPSGGGVWVATSGTWTANGTKGTSATAASSYPIATAELYTNAPTIDVDTDGSGAGVAFWVSDSSNWWGVVPWRATDTVTNYTQNTSYGQTCNSYSQVCTSYTSSKVCQEFIKHPRYGAPACAVWITQSTCATYGSNCNSYSQTVSYSQGSFLSYAAGQRYLRLLKNVSGTVSTVTDQTVSAAVASIKVIVNSAGTITARAYSSAGQTNQTGTDLTNTPSSPTKATKHGILLAPGGSEQATAVDNLTMKAT